MNTKKNNEASVGVFVYNEEKNIANILFALSKQKNERINLKEIIVVSSGSTDRTNEIAKSFERKNKKIKLIIQKKREGKMAAINLFLGKMKGQIAVIESGDTIPREDCIEELCKPFLDDAKLGMTGVRAIPTNNKNTFLGYIVHYWWWMAFRMPRVGEMVAFRRKLIDKIPPNATLDEAWIEAILAKKGYKIETVGTAIIANKLYRAQAPLAG
jgi:cellulose synthase/poly-beta-1,6-N-acetylglucosamine synthase-like glycosyltransferase